MNRPSLIIIHDKNELSAVGFEPDTFVRVSRDKSGGYEWHGPCPKGCGNRQLVISNGFYWCRMCGFSGALTPVDNSEVHKIDQAEAAERYRRLKLKEEAERRKIIESLTKSKQYIAYHKILLGTPEAIEILRKDGIGLPEIKKFLIGYIPRYKATIRERGSDQDIRIVCPAFTFPIIWSGRVMNIRIRLLDQRAVESGNKYRPFRRGLGISFLPAIHDGDDSVIITEGEKKAIVLWKNGFSAIGLFGVNSYYEEWGGMVKERFPKRFIIFDGDNEAVKHAEDRAARIFDAKVLHVPGKIDDLLVNKAITPTDLRQMMSEEEGEWWT